MMRVQASSNLNNFINGITLDQVEEKAKNRSLNNPLNYFNTSSAFLFIICFIGIIYQIIDSKFWSFINFCFLAIIITIFLDIIIIYLEKKLINKAIKKYHKILEISHYMQLFPFYNRHYSDSENLTIICKELLNSPEKSPIIILLINKIKSPQDTTKLTEIINNYESDSSGKSEKSISEIKQDSGSLNNTNDLDKPVTLETDSED